MENPNVTPAEKAVAAKTASETTETTTTYDEAALKAESERLIRLTCQRNGISPDDLSPEHLASAVQTAKRNLEANSANPYAELYRQKEAENQALRASLDEIKAQGVVRATQNDRDTKVPSVEEVRARMSPTQWHLLTNAGKLTALSIDPETVDHKLAKACFSAKADHVIASDLMKSNPKLYRQLREVAKVFNYLGK